MNRTRNLLLAALAGLLSAPAIAQVEGHDPNFAAPKVYIRGVEVRAPAEMNTNEIVLVGMEEGGLDYRANTPALAGDFKPKPVDVDAVYRNRLAMYEQGGTSLEVTSDAVAEAGAATAEQAAPAPAPKPAASGNRSGVGWLLLVAGLAMVAVVLLALRGLRRASAS